MTAAFVAAAGGLNGKQIRLLIVDDSGFMRCALRKLVERDVAIKVVGEARNGAEAQEMAARLNPDVITMDVEMPEVDGLEATRAILRTRSVPIIMVSSLTVPNADTTLRALADGAVDFISKSSSFVDLDIIHIEQELRRKIHYWAGHVRRQAPAQDHAVLPRSLPVVRPATPFEVVVIGVSTGGPKTLPELLRQTGPLTCPVVVAQHMPEVFTASFATQLARDTGLTVAEGSDAMTLLPRTVTILRGGTDGVLFRQLDGRLRLIIRHYAEAPIHPSVDHLFQSAANSTKSALAVILTGMGEDGTQGAGQLAKRGFPVLVQRPESCVVGGMPSAAIKAGCVSESLDIPEIARRLRAVAGAG